MLEKIGENQNLGLFWVCDQTSNAGSVGVNKIMRRGIVLYMNDLMMIMTRRESLALDNLKQFGWLVRLERR